MKCLLHRVISKARTHAGIHLPDVRHDDRTFRNEVAVVHVILLDAVGSAERGRRAPADDLLQRRGEVGERVAIRECGQSVDAYVGVDLVLDFLLYFGVHGHGEEEGGHCGDGLLERKKRRVVSGRDAFICRTSEFLQCRRHQSRDWTRPT